MTQHTTGPVVAILNSDVALLALLEEVFQQAGFRTLTALLAEFPTQEALLRFLLNAGVRVVVYDIAPPYEAGWAAYQRFALAAEACALLLVVTSASRTALQAYVGSPEVAQLDEDRAGIEYAVLAVQALLKEPPTLFSVN